MNDTAAPRRIHERLQGYWNDVRGDAPFPPESAIDPDAIADIWDDCFLLHLRDHGADTAYRYTYLGKALIDAYGDDLAGKEVYRRLVDTEELPKGDLAEHFGDVLATRDAVIRDGEFINTRGMIIKYRACMVPLGAGNEIEYILGGMKWRAF